jgi:predicted RNA-binding protein with TRAM domain
MSPKANPDVKINGKVVIVTGSNCGIGIKIRKIKESFQLIKHVL